jgi:hypothetical protein
MDRIAALAAVSKQAVQENFAGLERLLTGIILLPASPQRAL